jgi:hypothetical protein
MNRNELDWMTAIVVGLAFLLGVGMGLWLR